MIDFNRLKRIFSDDPETLLRLEKQQQADILKEIASNKPVLGGVTAIKGDQGEIGAVGPQGIEGKKGDKGDRGEPGRDGLNGLDGKDGENGKNGKDGEKGKPTSPKEVIEEIKNLSGDAEKDFSVNVGKKLDISHIRNANSFLFNGKRVKFEELLHGGGSSAATGVTNVTATAPITSSGGTTPNISTSMATNKLIGRGTAGTGVIEEISLGNNLSLSGTTLNASGGMAIGGTVTSGTAGSVLFVGSGPVLAQNNASLFWDNTNGRLGIGTATPTSSIDILGGSSGIVKFGDLGSSYAGIGFSSTFNFANASLFGEGVNTYINSPSGGRILMRSGNDNIVTFASDGTIQTLGASYGRFLNNYGNQYFDSYDDTGNIIFRLTTGFLEGLRISPAANVGVGGVTSPSARLHLPAGTATASTAPLKLTAGTLLTTPELGTMEYTDNGTTGHLYFTLNVAGVATRVQII